MTIREAERATGIPRGKLIRAIAEGVLRFDEERISAASLGTLCRDIDYNRKYGGYAGIYASDMAAPYADIEAKLNGSQIRQQESRCRNCEKYRPGKEFCDFFEAESE